MSWGEAVRLTKVLAADSSSQVGAALSGWDSPVPRDALILMDLFDLTHEIAWAQGGGKGRRPAAYPRPKVRALRDARREAAVERRLRAMGHGALLDRLA